MVYNPLNTISPAFACLPGVHCGFNEGALKNNQSSIETPSSCLKLYSFKFLRRFFPVYFSYCQSLDFAIFV